MDTSDRQTGAASHEQPSSEVVAILTVLRTCYQRALRYGVHFSKSDTLEISYGLGALLVPLVAACERADRLESFLLHKLPPGVRDDPLGVLQRTVARVRDRLPSERLPEHVQAALLIGAARASEDNRLGAALEKADLGISVSE